MAVKQQEDAEMVTLYKWIIGLITSIVLFFGAAYINGTQEILKEQSKQILNHEQRITTLEESAKNMKELLQSIQTDVKSIQRAVVK